MDFETRLQAFINGAQEIINKEWEAQGHTTWSMPPLLERAGGRRFIKIVRFDRRLDGTKSGQSSIFAFIDAEGGMIDGTLHKIGDVLKPATYKAPAKHARGNIYDDKNGLDGVRWTGPAYLK